MAAAEERFLSDVHVFTPFSRTSVVDVGMRDACINEGKKYYFVRKFIETSHVVFLTVIHTPIHTPRIDVKGRSVVLR